MTEKDKTDRIVALMSIIESSYIKDKYTKIIAEIELINFIYSGASSRTGITRKNFKKKFLLTQ